MSNDLVPEPVHDENPCQPTPCGPNSQCREANRQAVCSCVQGYIGSPPFCRPECVSNSECQSNQACINMKCKDPCPGLCGINAECRVVNHNGVCSCYQDYTGDPYSQCNPKPCKHSKVKSCCSHIKDSLPITSISTDRSGDALRPFALRIQCRVQRKSWCGILRVRF